MVHCCVSWLCHYPYDLSPASKSISFDSFIIIILFLTSSVWFMPASQVLSLPRRSALLLSCLTPLQIPSLKSLCLHVAHIHLPQVVLNSPIFCDSLSSQKCCLFDASVIMILMGARLVLAVWYSACSAYTQNPVFCAVSLLTSMQHTNNDYWLCTIHYGILDSGRKNWSWTQNESASDAY